MLKMDARVFYMYFKYEDMYWKKKEEAYKKQEYEQKSAEESAKNQQLMGAIASNPARIAELEEEARRRSHDAI